METVNHEYYVSPEIAKLLKEAGFDWKVRYMYRNNNPTLCICTEAPYRNMLKSSKCPMHWQYAAPTLEVAQSWIREVKNCSIKIDVFVHDLDKSNIYYTYNWIMYLDGERYSGSNWDDTRYYEVAQESAIKKALELLLKKGK